jgi:hypothetical protein
MMMPPIPDNKALRRAFICRQIRELGFPEDGIARHWREQEQEQFEAILSFEASMSRADVCRLHALGVQA